MSQFYKDGTGDPNILQVYMKNSGVGIFPLLILDGTVVMYYFIMLLVLFYAKTFLLEYFHSLIKFHFYLEFYCCMLAIKKTFLTFLKSPSVNCKIIAEPYF